MQRDNGWTSPHNPLSFEKIPEDHPRDYAATYCSQPQAKKRRKRSAVHRENGLRWETPKDVQEQ